MAHFAELNSNKVVLRVIVVANEDTADAYGVEKEYIGAAFCERLLGGTWKQTSYNGKFRGKFAGIGDTFDEVNNVFVAPVSETPATPIDYSASIPSPSMDLNALTSQSI
jgi:hypothetical protein